MVPDMFAMRTTHTPHREHRRFGHGNIFGTMLRSARAYHRHGGAMSTPPTDDSTPGPPAGSSDGSDEPGTHEPSDPPTDGRGRWTRVPATDLPEPIVETAHYVELVLAHSTLPETRLAGSLWPSAMPYRLDGEDRVWFWRDRLAGGSRDDWSDGTGSSAGWVATPDGLHTVPRTGPLAPELVTRTASGIEVVVDGMVAGESTTTVVEEYEPPAISVAELTPHAVELEIAGERALVGAGDRETFPLPTQTVECVEPPTVDDAAGSTAARRGSVSVTPRLHVRYPGARTLAHPAPGADYLLFPSFGLDLDTQGRVPVDPAATSLDPAAVAESLGCDLDARPYAERVLWEAFVYAAFDPDCTSGTELAQFENGLLAVLDPPPSLR